MSLLELYITPAKCIINIIKFDDDLLAKSKKATYVSLSKEDQVFSLNIYTCTLFSDCCFITDY